MPAKEENEMMTISKGKVIRIGFFITTMIFFVGSIFHVHEAYAEMKEVSCTSEILKDLETFETELNNTKVRLTKKLELISSSDPDWDKARVFSTYFFINPTRGGDDYRGSFAIAHQNGDQTFVSYYGSWEFKMPKDGFSWTAESKGYFIGGTGKFDGIKGSIMIKDVGRGTTRVSSDWEIKYDIK
jgi:hypothetical protein